MTKKDNNKPQFMKITEAAEFLNLKTSRLRYEVFYKKIPFLKIGRSIRFSEHDLLAWLEQKKQPCVAESLNK